LEIGALGLDLFDGAGGEFVDEVAENNAILQDVLILSRGQRLTQDVENPFQHLGFLFFVANLSADHIKNMRYKLHLI